MTQVSRENPEPPSALVLWLGVLLPPAAFLVSIETSYALVHRACIMRTETPLHATALISLVLVLSGAGIAWRAWRRTDSRIPDDEGSPLARSRLLAVLGLLSGIQFTLVLLAQWLAVFLVPVCA